MQILSEYLYHFNLVGRLAGEPILATLRLRHDLRNSKMLHGNVESSPLTTVFQYVAIVVHAKAYRAHYNPRTDLA